MMIPVESSMIDAVDYHENKQEFDVVFKNGDIYRYFEVPKGIYEKFMLAKSKGQFLSAFVIKAGYRYEKIGNEASQEVPVDMTKMMTSVFKGSLDMMESAGLARREMDENGNVRIILIGEYVKEVLNK